MTSRILSICAPTICASLNAGMTTETATVATSAVSGCSASSNARPSTSGMNSSSVLVVQDYLSALVFRFAHKDLATRQRAAEYANHRKSVLDLVPDIWLTCTNVDGHGIDEPRSTVLCQVRIQLSTSLQQWPGASVVALEGGRDHSNRNDLFLWPLLIFHESH